MEFDNFVLKGRMMQTNVIWLRKRTKCLRIGFAEQKKNLKIIHMYSFVQLYAKKETKGPLSLREVNIRMARSSPVSICLTKS